MLSPVFSLERVGGEDRSHGMEQKGSGPYYSLARADSGVRSSVARICRGSPQPVDYIARVGNHRKHLMRYLRSRTGRALENY